MADAGAATPLWLLTDGKPGHRNQLQGLVNALPRYLPIRAHWFEINESTDWLSVLRGRSGLEAPTPGAVIGAGHATHRALLAAARQTGAPSVVLMKPSLPLALFDFAIVPRHDLESSDSTAVLLTEGVLNTVQPAKRPDPERSLLLLGGDSRHYHWDSRAVCDQVATLVSAQPQREWHLTDSRRSPPECIAAIAALGLPNLQVVPHQRTPGAWVAEQLAQASQVWVSPDSVSMVYEALTAGATTGLFELEVKQRGRVVRGIEKLVASGRLTTFGNSHDGLHMQASATPMWEADRAASWLAERLQRQGRARA